MQTVLGDAALYYATSRHWKVFPLKPGTKVPFEGSRGFKDATDDPAIIQRWWTEDPRSNIGIATGWQSGILVLDTDVKNGKPGMKSLDELKASLGAMETLTQRTPSGGLHLIFKHPDIDIRNTTDIRPGIDVRANGGYIVAAPSIADGAAYSGMDLKIEPSPAPDGLIDLLQRRESLKQGSELPVVVDLPQREWTGDRAELISHAQRYLAAVPGAIQGQHGDDHTFRCACKLVRGFALTDDEAITLLLDWNTRCIPPWSESELRKKIHSARNNGSTYAEPFGARIGGSEEKQIRELVNQAVEEDKETTTNDEPLQAEPVCPNISNAVHILEKDPYFQDRFYFDEFLNRLVTGNPPREWTDADDIILTVEIQRKKGIPKMSHETVAKAVSAVAVRRVRNCVKQWLDSLQWDGELRLESFFEDHFGTQDSAYAKAVGRNFWLSMVARIYNPGCKADYMVILEGPQGVRKSTALAAIGGPYFAESDANVSGKDFYQNLEGKFLIEIAEMDAFSRADVTRVKAIVTSQVDRYRESYGRRAKDHPRQCIFVGTTNKDDWNKDSTGARRFWPIDCKDIDVDAIRHNRDQFFAEAVHRFKAGETWWEMPADETAAEQSHRYDDDPWIDDIGMFVAPKPSVTVREILVDALHFKVENIEKQDHFRVADCLRRLGWKKSDSKRKLNKRVSHVWLPS